MEKYIIENYRGFKKTELQLGDISIFTGENGMGKTSIINIISAITKIKKMNKVHMDFPDISNNNKTFKVYHEFSLEEYYHKKSSQSSMLGYEYYEFKSDSQGNMYIGKFATFREKDIVIFTFSKKDGIKFTHNKFEIKKENSATQNLSLIKKIIKEKEKEVIFLPWFDPNFENDIYFTDIFNLFSKITTLITKPEIKKIFAFKTVNEVFENIRQSKETKVKKKEVVIDYILQFNNGEKPNRIYKKKLTILKKQNTSENVSIWSLSDLNNHDIFSHFLKTETVKSFNSFLNKAGFIQQLKIKKIEGASGGYIELYLSLPDKQNIDLKLAGDGILSIIPFFIGLKNSGNIIIREPEIHMHPKAIAQFGTEIYKINNKIIIETHSSFLVDRLRYELSTNTNKKQIVINTLFTHENKKMVEHTQVKEDGRFEYANKYMEFIEDETMKWFK